jgi:hypothetical protein
MKRWQYAMVDLGVYSGTKERMGWAMALLAGTATSWSSCSKDKR